MDRGAEERHHTTRLLRAAREGDGAATEELFPLVYDRLRRLAASFLRRESPGHTLQATALVHEVYVRLVDDATATWEDRAHFLSISARVMRRVLVDHARRRAAAKRGGEHQRVPLEEGLAITTLRGVDMIGLDETLARLETLSPRRAQVVEMKVFLGMTNAQTAESLGVSEKTVEKDWTGARSWLRRNIDRDET